MRLMKALSGRTLLIIALLATLSGCPPQPRPVSQAASPPDRPAQPETVSDAAPPTTREEFEAWNLRTSPNAPRDDRERGLVDALRDWLEGECEVKNLVLIPGPDYDDPSLPDYFPWYEGMELAIYVFTSRETDTATLNVGPPEATPWSTVYMAREGGHWVVQKATTGPEGTEEQTFYEQGKGFIDAEAPTR